MRETPLSVNEHDFIKTAVRQSQVGQVQVYHFTGFADSMGSGSMAAGWMNGAT
jgi:hypothetical protein